MLIVKATLKKIGAGFVNVVVEKEILDG